MKFETNHIVKMAASARAGGCGFITFDNGMSVISNEPLWQLVRQVTNKVENQLTEAPPSNAAAHA